MIAHYTVDSDFAIITDICLCIIPIIKDLGAPISKV